MKIERSIGESDVLSGVISSLNQMTGFDLALNSLVEINKNKVKKNFLAAKLSTAGISWQRFQDLDLGQEERMGPLLREFSKAPSESLEESDSAQAIISILKEKEA